MKIIFSHSDIEEFIEGLQVNASAKVIRMFELLEKFGHKLRMPHVKKVNSELFELRIRGEQEVRFLFFFDGKKIVVVLRGFIKKKQKIPVNHLQTALQRKKKYLDKPI